MAASTLQVGMDETLRKRAEKVFADFGMDANIAIRMFFAQVAQTGSIPYVLTMEEDHFTPEEEQRLEESMAESYRKEDTYGPFHDSKSLIQSLHKHAKEHDDAINA